MSNVSTGQPPAMLLGTATAIASVIAASTLYVREHWNPVSIDFKVFWLAARRSDPYISGAYFVNPPTALPLIQPLRVVGFWPGYAAWTVLSIIVFYLAARRLVGTAAAFLSLFSAAAVHGLLLGQAAMLLSAAMLSAVSLTPFWCGTIIGTVMAVKPQLLVMAPVVFALRKDWTSLGGMLVGSSLVVLLSLTMFGVQPWINWVAALPSFRDAIVRLQILRHVITPASMGPKLGVPMAPWLFGGAILSLTLVVSCSRRVEGAGLVALMVVASILTSPYALSHDLVGAIPAVSAFILSSSMIGYVALAVFVFCGIFLPFTLPAAALLAIAAVPENASRVDDA